MKKGSASVEAFRDLSHVMANFFGDSDRRRRSKEVAFADDMRVLVEEMIKRASHVLVADTHFVPEPVGKKKRSGKLRSGVVDVMVTGAEIWQNGKFTEFIKTTAYDPELGYPMDISVSDPQADTRLDSNMVFDDCTSNVLEIDSYTDLHGDETGDGGGGSLGGGDEFSTGVETF